MIRPFVWTGASVATLAPAAAWLVSMGSIYWCNRKEDSKACLSTIKKENQRAFISPERKINRRSLKAALYNRPFDFPSNLFADLLIRPRQ